MAEIDDEDNFPNDFDGLDLDNIPGLQAPATRRDTSPVFVPSAVVTQDIVPFPAARPEQPTGLNIVEEMDSAFLAAVDALEAHALDEMARDGPRTDKKASSSSKNKGKRKAESEDEIDVRTALAEYETELTCPICCDLFVGAQVANPCGHTCCGECGYGWFSQNIYKPTCAVCRTNLCLRTPLLPNFVVDGFVRQHLQVLARSGRPEWQERGYRTIEWNKRAESWRKQANDRAAQKKLREAAHLRRHQPRYFELDDYPYVPPWLEMDNDGPLVPRVMPRRGTRSRR